MNEATIAHEIERKARQLAHRTPSWIATPRDTIHRELSLTLEHIDAFRKQHGGLEARILETECRLETLLLKLPDELRIESQLCALQQERRRLDMHAQEQTRTLEHRLLSLLEKHLHLAFDD